VKPGRKGLFSILRRDYDYGCYELQEVSGTLSSRLENGMSD
jgi:hypothetical protein